MIGCIAGRRGVARSIKFFNKSIVAVLFCTTALMSTMSDSFATDDYGIYSYKDGNGPTSVKVKGRVNGNLDGIHVHIEGAQSSTTGSGDSDITIEAGAGDIIGGRDGIFVNNYGAGATNIATEATISGGRTGIQVVNGKTSTDVTINAKGTVTGVEFGIGIDNYGTGSTLINSDGEVQATEYGIFATNKEPTTTDLTIISNGTIHGKTGIAAENYGSGITTVNVNADVSGVENSGLYVDTRASDAIVDIGSGRISGKKIGIDLSNTGNGSAEITNHGIVEGGQVAISAKSVNGNKINLLNKGEIFNTSAKWDDLAIESSGGSLSLVNDELVTGRIISGSFNDSFSNHNLWQTIGVTDFGDGDDTVANENLVITANSANAETTTFSGLEKFINRGVLNLSDNAAGDRTITSGDYVGESNSVVEIDTELGDDNSLTDQLVIEGNSSGSSHLLVNSLLGNGRPTNEGIKVIDVKGNSAAVFSLSENSPNSYLHDGQQTMVAGAFAYKLYKHAASASDGDWYLRSQLKNPLPEHDPLPVIDPQPPIIDPQPPVVDRQSLVVNQQQAPLYQAGAPVYETYAQTLQALNTISTLKQRVGNRHWSDGKGTSKDKAHSTINAQAIWARIEGSHAHVKSETSTTGANHESNVWRIQSGLDGGLYEGNAGVLFGGITALRDRIHRHIICAW
ncbi:autotransporter outer membrane beta-barrel domain-containing protein [Phyllobacterium sp. YR531]|uniref:autotransporter outer membrane beta-barrel domain-containing protein n=1 Tax=Phyllobacterium sp. YR531 TaxID=1144343 RepID=UPI00026FBAC3|nr:autotransporter outer membrane beta-barrel domain-containing protein [Phyllobacterium sp. YR531]EJN04836.1 outer membrane autotransporter barrel domain-containing protein [Phyllobacterium sp. YR531]